MAICVEYTNSDTHCYTYTGPDTYSNRHQDPNPDPNADDHAYSNCDKDPTADLHSEGYQNADTDDHGYTIRNDMKMTDVMDRRRIVLAAMMPTIAAAILILAAGALFAQSPQDWPGERIPLSAVAWALTGMAIAVVAEAGGCWWLLRQYVATLDRAKEREEQLVGEMKDAEQRHAQEISDTIREVMPLTIKLTEFIPTQQKLIQSIADLVQELGKRRQEGEGRRS